jgi:FAD dependent oxidoreductase TIGR03364
LNRRVIVVGAGILGTMHALFALEQGYEVVHLDRELAARGASVRNFGLVWVSGRAGGAELALALRARRLWEELARRVPGLPFRPVGSLTVALGRAELELMEAACCAADAPQRQWQLLSTKEALTVCPELTGSIEGALLCRSDAIVEPRVTAPLLREHLAQNPAYSWFPGRQVVAIDEGAVLDDHGAWHRGDQVYLCTGATVSGLISLYAQDVPLRRVRLQMLETAPYAGRVTTALADGASMRYYPAYELPARAGLPAQPTLAAANGAQLLLVQRADGSLTIGDTHDYDEPFPFDVEEDIYDYLLARAGALLRGPGAKSWRPESKWSPAPEAGV